MLLLVDDDQNFREALGVLLRGDGYHVEEFPDPGHVPPLESLPTIQALVVDHEMPGESGLAFADRFHRALPAVPIVMVTSYPVEELKHLLAARPHITLRHKPIDYDELAGLLPAPP